MMEWLVSTVPYVVSVMLVLITSLVFYEIARVTAARLPRWAVHPHLIASAAIILLFFCHGFSIVAYATVYFALQTWMPALGMLVSPEAFPGEYDGGFEATLYYSAATYTSLGYGDIVPQGRLRILSAAEALNGLVLIGWSASFGYILMKEFWELHGKSGHKKTRKY